MALEPPVSSKRTLFLTEKYINPVSNPLSRRNSTAGEKSEAIHALIREVWPGRTERHYRVLHHVFVQLIRFHHTNRFAANRIATSISILIDMMLLLSGPALPQAEFVFAQLKQMLLRHCIQRPPFSIAVFSLIELKLLTRFFLDHVLRHCHLYQYLLGRTEHLQLHLHRRIAPDLPAVRPLAQAVAIQPERVAHVHSGTENLDSESLTQEQIQMILSDPVAKARFESLVQPKLAELQSRLDNELEKLDRMYANKN